MRRMMKRMKSNAQGTILVDHDIQLLLGSRRGPVLGEGSELRHVRARSGGHVMMLAVGSTA